MRGTPGGVGGSLTVFLIGAVLIGALALYFHLQHRRKERDRKVKRYTFDDYGRMD